jgi:hypothetical protein
MSNVAFNQQQSRIIAALRSLADSPDEMAAWCGNGFDLFVRLAVAEHEFVLRMSYDFADFIAHSDPQGDDTMLASVVDAASRLGIRECPVTIRGGVNISPPQTEYALVVVGSGANALQLGPFCR